MSKVAVNIPDEEKEIIDKFVEKTPRYKNRSEFIRKALRKEMENDYNVLKSIAGSWSEEKADNVEERIEKLKEEDIRAQSENDTGH